MADNFYYAPGKLLLTAEYFVLDGARALAIPTRYGQSLVVDPNGHTGSHLRWTSYDAKEEIWFEGRFSLPAAKILAAGHGEKAERLQQLLLAVEALKPGTLAGLSGHSVETRLEFPPEWGLGASSTLVANLASWLQVDPFELLWKSFGGSGYDLACALAAEPIRYQLREGKPAFVPVVFDPPFRENLYFVYLEKKQNSREGIRRFREKGKSSPVALSKINELTERVIQAQDLETFNACIREHERIVAEAIDMPPVLERLFPDFWGEVKSLGAWGGDFVLATSTEPGKETLDYFNKRGFPTVIRYEDIIKNSSLPFQP